MCEIGDLDACDVWREGAARARKPATCACCRGAINPGDPYLSHFSVFEGDSTFEKMCWLCWLAREDFNEAHRFGSCCPGTFKDLLVDCFAHDTDPKWGLMLVAMDARAGVAS